MGTLRNLDKIAKISTQKEKSHYRKNYSSRKNTKNRHFCVVCSVATMEISRRTPIGVPVVH